MATERRKISWSVGTIIITIIGGLMIVIGAVLIGVIIYRIHNSNRQQMAMRPMSETIESRCTDEKQTPQSDDPFVTQSQLKRSNDSLWKRTLKLAKELKDYVVKCLDEPTQVRTSGRRGRMQSAVNMVLFERAILYQLSYGRCSANHACEKSFIRVKGGYASARSLYDFWNGHPMEVETTRQILTTRIAENGLTAKAFYKKHALENAALLQEI